MDGEAFAVMPSTARPVTDEEPRTPPAPAAEDARPGVVFAMRYPSDVGFVWNSMARTYDRVAGLLEATARCYVAYPELVPDRAYRPRHLEPIAGDFYSTAPANRPHLTALIGRHRVRAVVYMGCDPAEIDLSFLRRQGVRTVNAEQESYPPAARQSPLKKVVKVLLRRHLRRNLHDVYVANAEHQRQFLLSFACLPPERVVAIVNGVDTDLFTPGPPPDPAELGLPKTEHYAVTVCQARPEKRVDFLIEVARRVFQARPELSLTFVHVGGGQCLDEWRSRAEAAGLGTRFRFAGAHHDVLPFHRRASFLVHAAERESFGFVLAEAMAVGKPVIATDAPGPREIIADGRTGFVVGRDDAEAFAAQVLRLCADDGLRAQLGTSALAAARARFTLDRQTRELGRVIGSLLGRQAGV
jgi:glycosyltransferase involved in cell wall biosynthesis